MRRFGRGRDRADAEPPFNPPGYGGMSAHKRAYIDEWNEYIHNLARLKYRLPSGYYSRLDRIMSDLSELVTEAGMEIE